MKNKDGEKLDFIIEGSENPDKVVLFLHGFGTSLHEGANIFDDISSEIIMHFPNMTTVRFSFSGYGKSEGKQEEKNLNTMVEDFRAVYELIKDNFDVPIISLSFSMGNFVAIKNNDLEIEKSLMVNLPTADISGLADHCKRNPGLEVDKNGTWHVPRSDGTTTLIGKDFWNTFDQNDLLVCLKKWIEKNNEVVFRPIYDEQITAEMFSMYKDFKFDKFVKIPGDHNYTRPTGREALLKELTEELKNS